jgi:hypothetical protein
MGRGPYVSTGLAEDVIFGLMFKYTKKPAMWQVQVWSFQARGMAGAKTLRQAKFALLRELKETALWQSSQGHESQQMRSERWWDCWQWQWSLWSEDFQILCVPFGKIYSRTHGCKWSLLTVREGKYEREHGGLRWNLEAQKACVSSPLKPTVTYGKGGATWFLCNHQGAGRGVGSPRPGEGGPWAREWSIWNVILSHRFSESPEHFLLLACLGTRLCRILKSRQDAQILCPLFSGKSLEECAVIYTVFIRGCPAAG